jgi:hypothetical protein
MDREDQIFNIAVQLSLKYGIARLKGVSEVPPNSNNRGGPPVRGMPMVEDDDFPTPYN